MWELKPVPTAHVDEISNSSVLRTPVVPRRSSRKRKLDSDELPFFNSVDRVKDFDSFNTEDSPKNFNFKRLRNGVQYYNLIFNRENGIPPIHECISID